MNFPKILLCINQLYAFSEFLAKHAAATNRNGVVGRMGKINPIMPKVNEKYPTIEYMIRLNLLEEVLT
jgi:hypothetical protein